MRKLLLIACFVPPATMALAQATPPPSTPPSQGRPAPLPPPAIVGPQAPAPSPGQGRGQTPVPPTAAPGQGPAPGVYSNWQNVKLDVTISDSLTAEIQTKRTVSMMIADGRNGQVRSNSSSGANINIDASPTIRQADGRILLRLTIEYQPNLTTQQMEKSGASSRTSFSQSLSLIVQDGRPIVAAQSADPGSDRKVSLEILATIQK